MTERVSGELRNADLSSGIARGGIPLSEIPRPFSVVNVLEANGNGIMINDELVLSLGFHFDQARGENAKTVHISRELTKPVIFDRTGFEVRRERKQDYWGINKFGELFIRLKAGRPSCFIGEKYRLSRIESDNFSFAFKLESTDPIETVDPVSVDQDIPGYLKEIRQRKLEAAEGQS